MEDSLPPVQRAAAGIIRLEGEAGLGTAFVISRSGLALTNHHVVVGQNQLLARFDNDRVVPVRVLRSDEEADVALIEVQCDPDCLTLSLGSANDVTEAVTFSLSATPPDSQLRSLAASSVGLDVQGDPMGDGVPSWVERDFRAYLRCGILAHGFARARCSGCGYDFLVAFSCRSRGVCPSSAMRAVWSRPRPISSTMSCRLFQCANGCSPFRSASDPSCTTTPRSPALCCTSFYAPAPLCRTTLRQASPGAVIVPELIANRLGLPYPLR